MITAQPQGNTAREGGTVTLSVTATSQGEAATYQWLRDGQPVAGATAASYTTSPIPFTTTSYSAQYRVRVSNSAGMVESAAAVVSRSFARSWQDIESPFPSNLVSQERATVVADAAGRTHVLSVQQVGGSQSLFLGAYGRNDDNDTWSGTTSFSMLGAGSIERFRAASSADGSMMVVWEESLANAIGGVSNVLRAAVYQPNAGNLNQAGTWTVLSGYVHASGLPGYTPAITSPSAGVYDIAWLQPAVSAGNNDAMVRRYTVPTNGVPAASGFGAIEALEGLGNSAGSPIMLASHAGHTLAAFNVTVGGSTRTYINLRAAGGSWSSGAAADAGLPGNVASRDNFAAVSGNGTAMLGVTDNAGRLYLRRFDMAAGIWLDTSFSWRANSEGGDPVMLADPEGNFDIFGVISDPAAGNTTTLARWRYVVATGWGNAFTALALNGGNRNNGDAIYQISGGRDTAGNVVLVYYEKPVGGTLSVKALRYSALDGAWTTPAAIDPPAVAPTTQYYPTVAVSPAGAATVAWQQVEGSANTSLRRARLR